VQPQSFDTIHLLETHSFADQRGATAVEYGLLVALIAAVIIASIVALGPVVANLYQAVQWW